MPQGRRNRDEKYIDFLLEWLAPLGLITARAMFGGHMVYRGGIPFALVAGGVLYLKVDDQTRPRFEALGLEPFRPYEDRSEVMQYYPPPPEFFDNADAMREWGGEAVEVGRRAQAGKKTKARRAIH